MFWFELKKHKYHSSEITYKYTPNTCSIIKNLWYDYVHIIIIIMMCEGMSRCDERQLQASENYSYLVDFRPNICNLGV